MWIRKREQKSLDADKKKSSHAGKRNIYEERGENEQRRKEKAFMGSLVAD